MDYQYLPLNEIKIQLMQQVMMNLIASFNVRTKSAVLSDLQFNNPSAHCIHLRAIQTHTHILLDISRLLAVGYSET